MRWSAAISRWAIRTGRAHRRHAAAASARRCCSHPPHILVTTPESLYILLTAGKSREHLRHVHTVIVDEIHAVADDKRGAHLALSLERLEALVCGENQLSPASLPHGLVRPPQRIGLSATQNPIELVAGYLTGSIRDGEPATIVQVGQRRAMDLAIEVPGDELSSVTTYAMWEEIFDKLAAPHRTSRSTLVFVNTRKLVERVAFALGQRLGAENVAAHHGSLSRTLRLDAEQRLKRGEIKMLVATASLELGIDIGDIDLVCQITTHARGGCGHAARGPRGPLARRHSQRAAVCHHARRSAGTGRAGAQDACRRARQAGNSAAAAGRADAADGRPRAGRSRGKIDALYEVLRRAYPYRDLTRERSSTNWSRSCCRRASSRAAGVTALT